MQRSLRRGAAAYEILKILFVFPLLALCVLVVRADGLKANEPPKLSSLIAAAEKTAERIRQEGAKWTTIHALNANVALEVLMECHANERRFEIRIASGGRSETVATVVDRGNLWYVDQGGTRKRYRPYESPFLLPTVVHFLHISELALLTKDFIDTDSVLRLDSTPDGNVAVRVRGTKKQQENLEATLKKLDEFRASLSQKGESLPAELLRQVEDLKSLQTKGFPIVVDQENGVLLQRGVLANSIVVRDFSWSRRDVGPRWQINPEEWEDHTKPFSAAELRDVIQILYNPAWQPGAPAGESDLMLLNVRNGDLRRLPFPYGQALKGCFSPDRTKAYVSGLNFDDGNMQMFEVSLASGECRLLNYEAMSRGHWLGPVISGDGRYLAVCQFMQGKMLDSQVYVLDLQQDKSYPIGKPCDVLLLDWHPDGKSLLCELREPNPGSEFTKNSFCELALNGSMRKIREGQVHCFLPQSKQFVFEDDQQEGRLSICDLDGKNTKPFGDGSEKLFSFAPSPDGRLAAMAVDKERGPQPCLLNVRTGVSTRLPVGPGLWSRPAWK